MDLRSYLRALRRNWWIVLLTTLLCGALAFFVAERTPRQYESSVTFFVSTPTDAAGTAVQADQYAQRRVNSYVQLLTSDDLARRIVASTDLDLTVTQVSEAITASAEPETVLLTATVTANSPVLAQQIAGAIGRQFGDMIDALDNRGTPDKPIVQLKVTSGPSLNPMPVAPKTKVIVGLGVLIGLSVGFAVAVFRETLDRTIRSTEQLRTLADAPLLGVIPLDKAAKRSPLTVDGHDRSVRAEAFRQLRTNLQFVDATRPVRVVVVTSSMASEGKSSTAGNLAISFSEYGQRVLLVDADLRRPRLSRLFGIEGAVGLTNVLIGQAVLDDVLQPWGLGGLTVLPSGTIPRNPSELLGSRSMSNLLADLRRRFDIIVVDTPPLLSVTDAAITARQADGAVVLVRYGKTTKHQLSSGLRSLQAVDARLLGTVFSMTPARDDDAYSVYGYNGEPAPQQENVVAKPSPALISRPAAQSHRSTRHRVGLRQPRADASAPTIPPDRSTSTAEDGPVEGVAKNGSIDPVRDRTYGS